MEDSDVLVEPALAMCPFRQGQDLDVTLPGSCPLPSSLAPVARVCTPLKETTWDTSVVTLSRERIPGRSAGPWLLAGLCPTQMDPMLRPRCGGQCQELGFLCAPTLRIFVYIL